MNALFECLRYGTLLYNILFDLWSLIWNAPNSTNMPHRQYFLSDDHEFDDSYTRVPEDAVYIEEWVRDGEKRCVVRYEGEEIPTQWTETPWDRVAACPWVWVGDKETEIDLTRTFNRFLVVGNRIELPLVLKMIQITDNTDLMYIEAGTFKECKFPGEGIAIKEHA
jgi:hypothetical protein